MKNKRFFRRLRFILPIPLFILLVSSPIGAQTDYPYREVPSSYIEASNLLSLTGDDASLQVTLPFPFTFYGVAYTTAYVNTNGYLNFKDGYSIVYNRNIPRMGYPDDTIFAFWDDLKVNPDASVRTEVRGTAPKRQFVIEWRNVTFSDDNTKRIDFEIVLHEKGAILLQYRNIDDDPREKGSSASIGLENEDGTAGVQYSFNTAALNPGESAILFGNVAKDVPVDITPRRCPNPVNLVSKGVLRVAILGTEDVPVSTIDPNSVTLQGIAPLRWDLEDVGTPYEPFVGKTDIYNCNNLGRDGYPDLVFMFDTEDVVVGSLSAAAAQAGQALLLKLEGKLQDGTDIKGEDSVVIIRGHHKWEKERGSIRGHHKWEKQKDYHKKEKDKKHDDD
jgi:hypothetical protein